MSKITLSEELNKDFQRHVVWQSLEKYMENEVEKCKEKLLKAEPSNTVEIIQIQEKAKTYSTIMNIVKTNG